MSFILISFVYLSNINKFVFVTERQCVCGEVEIETLNVFYDRMTVHRDKFLVHKTNRRTEFQIYWYYDSTCFGQPFRPSSVAPSRTSALVHFMQL